VPAGAWHACIDHGLVFLFSPFNHALIDRSIGTEVQGNYEEGKSFTSVQYYDDYRWPFSTRFMSQPIARFFGPTRARAQHDFLARHGHEPSTIFWARAGTSMTLGWAGLHSQPIVLAQHGTKSAGKTRPTD
jgi:hypothetical protein